jgi:hypothetical protein
VVNSKTGVVVIGENVRLLPVAITHGSISIRIAENSKNNSQYDTAIPNAGPEIEVKEEASKVHYMKPDNSLSSLVDVLNDIGVNTRDLICIGCCSIIHAQVQMNYDLLNYMATKEPDPDPDDREQIKKQFQTYFVKEVFLNQMFKSNHLYYSQENTSDYGMVNQLMINEFANQLVDSNFIDLTGVMAID